MKQRLDSLLVSRGLTHSREQAARLILAGLVTVNGVLIDKRGKVVKTDASLALDSPSSSFVSRAGGKLAAALDTLNLSCQGVIAMDVGASTGGFTDCLLQRGAGRIYAVDVGYGQLDYTLRTDPRVVVLERCNIRWLDRKTVPESIELAVIDVSFISLKLVLPCVLRFLSEKGTVVTLIKPQFEVGKGLVGKGGVVRDETQRHEVKQEIITYAETIGLRFLGALDSPITGRKGNKEILASFKRNSTV